ncbi:MAG: BlaI/MecI/CopY family transcriptional regulator [Planctomycetaceae bacterium]|nr:BlaI/MecI/CopY family transcriptional regulator [Planctomycetaceae bacterium]
MARPVSSQPTEVELQILRLLWDEGPSIARQVHNGLQAVKQTTYSTTVKMLSVMLDKGLVKRDEQVSPQVYRAAVSRESVGKRLARDLVDKVYDGAAMSLVLHALRTAKASPEELAKVRQLLDEMEGKS